MTARMVMLAARAGLLIGVLGLSALALTPVAAVETLIGPIGGVEHFVAFYALMTLAVAAFPNGRRNDICLTLAVFAAMIEVLRERMGAPHDLSKVFVDLAGVLAVHGPTHLEALRRNMRHYPAGAPFALPYPDRRRRGPATSKLATRTTASPYTNAVESNR